MTDATSRNELAPPGGGRMDKIRQMLASQPDDAFLVYSLAMEMAALGRVDEALAQFARTLELDAQNVPACTEAGKLLRSAGRLAEARAMFQRGLDLAGQLGQSHQADYLRQQLEALPEK